MERPEAILLRWVMVKRVWDASGHGDMEVSETGWKGVMVDEFETRVGK